MVAILLVRDVFEYLDGEIKGVEATQMVNMTKAIFYRRVKEYGYR